MNGDLETDARIGQAMRRWALEPDGALVRTPYASIQFVRRGGETLVLKCAPHGSEEAAGLEALALYDGSGAVRVYGIEDDCALMERAVPGTPLSALVREGRDDEATTIWCDVAERLFRSPPEDGHWPTTEHWGEGFARYLAGEPHPALPHDLLHEASDLYASLCASQGPRGLLHADLHHDNILFDEKRGWLAIDAKGLIGAFGYEVWAMLHNPLGAEAMYTDPSVMKRRLRMVCERLELQPTRVLQWCAAQSVLSGIAHVEDGDDDRFIHTSIAVANTAKDLLRVAEAAPL